MTKRLTLQLHTSTSCDVLTGIEAEVARSGSDKLLLRFILRGAISGVLMPPVAPSTRADELWRHTCFEAFVRLSSDVSYYEFNFAPSTSWAVYRFDGYRSGMEVAMEIPPPEIEAHSNGAGYVLEASVELPGAATWQIALSAVIEQKNGPKSYWALAHPPGEPDFHHPDCFALELAAPERA